MRVRMRVRRKARKARLVDAGSEYGDYVVAGELGMPASQLYTYLARASAAERVTQGDCTTLGVNLGHVNAEFLNAVDRLIRRVSKVQNHRAIRAVFWQLLVGRQAGASPRILKVYQTMVNKN